MSEERITEDQANEALMQLTHGTTGEEEVVEQPVEEEVVEAAPEDEAAPVVEEGEEPTEPAEAEPSEPEPAAEDNGWQARLDGMRDRYSQNEKILRDRFLRKSTAADKARRTLEAALGEEGVSREEAQRVINELKGTMNPESATYTPPAPQAPAQPVDREDQALAINSFLNEAGMSQDEATEFGNWLRTDMPNAMSPAEQAVGERDLDGFLRLAHGRWNTGKAAATREARRDSTVAAVRTVQNTQRRAAKAAAAQPSAPRKQPPTPKKGKSVKDFTKNDISRLLRESVEQHH
jgi:hypothetical protein